MGKTYKKRSDGKKLHDPAGGKKPKKSHNLVNDYYQNPNDDFFANSDYRREKRHK